MVAFAIGNRTSENPIFEDFINGTSANLQEGGRGCHIAARLCVLNSCSSSGGEDVRGTSECDGEERKIGQRGPWDLHPHLQIGVPENLPGQAHAGGLPGHQRAAALCGPAYYSTLSLKVAEHKRIP
jgi:hypothetical protein